MINNELEWSDDDESELNDNKTTILPPINNNIKSNIVVSNNNNSEYYNRKQDYKRSKLFNGSVKIKENINILNKPKLKPKFKYPMPDTPTHVSNNLTIELLEKIWQEFINYGAKESGFIQYQYINLIINNLNNKFNYNLKFNQEIKNIQLDDDDYISFIETINLFTNYSVDSINNQLIINSNKIHLPSCCALKSCKLHVNNKHVVLPTEKCRKGNHRLYVTYSKLILTRNGNVRYKDIPRLLDECNIPYNTKKLSDNFWYLKGEYLVTSYKLLEDLSDEIRLDDIEYEKDNNNLYSIPKWLKDELLPSELLLFEHHFQMIDKDGNGTLDADELVMLMESMGGKLSIEQAQQLIDQYDEDFNGTMGFSEFTTLMYKIIKGTVNLLDNTLVEALAGFRSQMKIFDDIADIKSNPIQYIQIIRYGEYPIVLDVNLIGPTNTIYENSQYHIRITFHDGYPYRKPDIIFLTRIYAVNVILQLTGIGVLYHLKYIWKPTWTLRKLFNHIIELLIEPNFNYLPEEMNLIINMLCDYKAHHYELENILDTIYEKEDNNSSDTSDSDENISNSPSNELVNEIDHTIVSKSRADSYIHSDEKTNQSRRNTIRRVSLPINNPDDWSDSDSDEDKTNLTSITVNTIDRSVKLPEIVSSNNSRKSSINTVNKFSLPNIIDSNIDSNIDSYMDSKPIEDILNPVTSISRQSSFNPKESSFDEIDNEIVRKSSNNQMLSYVSKNTILAQGIETRRRSSMISILSNSDVNTSKQQQINELIAVLTRVEQMHLNVMYLYLTDRSRFNESVKYYIELFSKITESNNYINRSKSNDPNEQTAIESTDNRSNRRLSLYDYGVISHEYENEDAVSIPSKNREYDMNDSKRKTVINTASTHRKY